MKNLLSVGPWVTPQMGKALGISDQLNFMPAALRVAVLITVISAPESAQAGTGSESPSLTMLKRNGFCLGGLWLPVFGSTTATVVGLVLDFGKVVSSKYLFRSSYINTFCWNSLLPHNNAKKSPI